MTLLYAGSTALSFVSGVVLARLLGAEGYGTYALALTTATLIGMITEFGLPILVLREFSAARVSGDWGHVRGLLQWSDRSVLVLSAVLIGATYLGRDLLLSGQSSGFLEAMLWSVLLIPFVAYGKLRASALLALDRVAASRIPIMILRPLLFILVSVALHWAFKGLEPQSAMAAQVAGAALAMAATLYLYRKARPPELRAARPVRSVASWLATALPMGMTEGLRLLQGQLGLLLVGALAGAMQAGLYRVADAVNLVTAVFISVVSTAAAPMFSRLWKAGDRAAVERIALVSAIIMTAGTFAAGLPIALAGDLIIPLIFGSQFTGASPVFTVLWSGMLAAATLGLCLPLANMIGRHVLATQSFVIIAGVNAALGAVLIPGSGAFGAAIATAGGMVAGSLYCAVRLWREERVNPTLFNPRLPGLLLQTLRQGVRGNLAALRQK